jgi:hypothetical protein
MESLPEPSQTRSGAHYATADEWIYRNPKFIQSFRKACAYFKTNQPIPQDLLEGLESFTISRREYYEYIAKREDQLRHVYLQNGKIKFDTFTHAPHGTAIGSVQTQVIRQLSDNIFIANNDCTNSLSKSTIFILSSCVAVALANLDREPDAAWRIRPARIPGYNASLHARMFPLDPMTGLEAPSLVVDMACSNESGMPKLTAEELGNYFGPGTGTRLLICVKVFKKATSHMPHRWWFGMAQREQVDGVLQNSATMTANSLPIRVDTHNDQVLSQIVDNVLLVDVDLLFTPLSRPPTYPRYKHVDMEFVRTEIVLDIRV